MARSSCSSPLGTSLHDTLPCSGKCRHKVLGDAEWQPRKHGARGRRQWRKVHLAIYTATSDIRAVGFTPSSDGDSPILHGLLGQIPENEQIDTVTADGAYDTRRCHAAITDRQATPIIPPQKNGRSSKEDCPAAKGRNETLRPGVLEALDRIPRAEPCRG